MWDLKVFFINRLQVSLTDLYWNYFFKKTYYVCKQFTLYSEALKTIFPKISYILLQKNNGLSSLLIFFEKALLTLSLCCIPCWVCQLSVSGFPPLKETHRTITRRNRPKILMHIFTGEQLLFKWRVVLGSQIM